MDDGTKIQARTEQVIFPPNCVALQPFIAKLGKLAEDISLSSMSIGLTTLYMSASRRGRVN